MKTVLIGLLGTTLDQKGKGAKRWSSWRPSISLCQQEDLKIDRFELIHGAKFKRLANNVATDIEIVSSETQVNLIESEAEDPWDFEQVYNQLLDFCLNYDFKPEEERYLLNITTGTHVAQICFFLLCEANYIPAQLIQSSPNNDAGSYQIIDLDLSRYDTISSRFKRQHLEGTDFLKSGIKTKNKAFNEMIKQIERVAIRSTAPILIGGPTGSGKSQLTRKIFELRQMRNQIKGEFVAVNCATLRGDGAMSTLFGHVKGAYTGAQNNRKGLLSKANKGLLFLDEIGELGADEQAMLLHALEEKQFYPVGADQPVYSDFQFIAGTNRDLYEQVSRGGFREDLLARIDLWHFKLPGLSQRREDIEPNIDFELLQVELKENHKVSFNKKAREHYLKFSHSAEAIWSGNFRDLIASIQRMVTLSDGGRINEEDVEQEIVRLRQRWGSSVAQDEQLDLSGYVSAKVLEDMDVFDQWQLQKVIQVCLATRNISEAGRLLFDRSRLKKKSNNDSHRLRQYLVKYDLNYEQLNNLS